MGADIHSAGIVVREGRDRTCQITRQDEGAGIRDGRRLHHALHLHRRRIGDRGRGVDGVRADEGPASVAQSGGIDDARVGVGSARIGERRGVDGPGVGERAHRVRDHNARSVCTKRAAAGDRHGVGRVACAPVRLAVVGETCDPRQGVTDFDRAGIVVGEPTVARQSGDELEASTIRDDAVERPFRLHDARIGQAAHNGPGSDELGVALDLSQSSIGILTIEGLRPPGNDDAACT